MLELARIPERVLLLVQDLAARGASKEQVEKAFTSAMGQVYAVDGAVPVENASTPSAEATRDPNQTVLPPKARQPVAPANPSDAQRAFRESFSGTLVTSVTKKFINIILEDRATVFKFQSGHCRNCIHPRLHQLAFFLTPAPGGVSPKFPTGKV